MSHILKESREAVAALQAKYECGRRDREQLLEMRISGATLREIRAEINALEKKRAMGRHNTLALSRADEARLNALLKIPEVSLFRRLLAREIDVWQRYETELKHLNALETVSESSLEEKRKAVAALRAEYDRLKQDSEEFLEMQMSGTTLRQIREEIDSLDNKRAFASRNNLAWSRSDDARLNALFKIPELSFYKRIHAKEIGVRHNYEKESMELKELEAVWAYQAPHSPPKVEDVAVLGELAGPHVTDPNIGAQLASNVNGGFVDGLSSKLSSVVTLRRKPNEPHCL